jgi:hypothetical protein
MRLIWQKWPPIPRPGSGGMSVSPAKNLWIPAGKGSGGLTRKKCFTAIKENFYPRKIGLERK